MDTALGTTPHHPLCEEGGSLKSEYTWTHGRWQNLQLVEEEPGRKTIGRSEEETCGCTYGMSTKCVKITESEVDAHQRTSTTKEQTQSRQNDSTSWHQLVSHCHLRAGTIGTWRESVVVRSGGHQDQSVNCCFWVSNLPVTATHTEPDTTPSLRQSTRHIRASWVYWTFSILEKGGLTLSVIDVFCRWVCLSYPQSLMLCSWGSLDHDYQHKDVRPTPLAPN